jgi:hypothetical protein
LIASKTGWSFDYILRQLPVAAGLQLILWHDTANGLRMRWSGAMNEGGGRVDIAAQMKSTLAQAHEDHSND